MPAHRSEQAWRRVRKRRVRARSGLLGHRAPAQPVYRCALERGRQGRPAQLGQPRSRHRSRRTRRPSIRQAAKPDACANAMDGPRRSPAVLSQSKEPRPGDGRVGETDLGRTPSGGVDQLHGPARRFPIAELDLRKEGHRLIAHPRELRLPGVLPLRPRDACDQLDEGTAGSFATHNGDLWRAHAAACRTVRASLGHGGRLLAIRDLASLMRPCRS